MYHIQMYFADLFGLGLYLSVWESSRVDDVKVIWKQKLEILKLPVLGRFTCFLDQLAGKGGKTNSCRSQGLLTAKKQQDIFDIADNMSKTLKSTLYTTLFLTFSPLKLYSDGRLVVQKRARTGSGKGDLCPASQWPCAKGCKSTWSLYS